MRRTKESFVSKLDQVIKLSGKSVLEVGCGAGNYTRQLADVCASIFAIDPNPDAIQSARQQVLNKNVTFQVMSAEDLRGIHNKFDVVIFTLSLHHVPIPLMTKAIDEGVRVVKPRGNLVFLEPAEDGTFFQAEIEFDACDGDERKAKEAAYTILKNRPRLSEVAELDDQTEFQWDSVDDFVNTMKPKTNLQNLEIFLQREHYTLSAQRRVNIFSVKRSEDIEGPIVDQGGI